MVIQRSERPLSVARLLRAGQSRAIGFGGPYYMLATLAIRSAVRIA